MLIPDAFAEANYGMVSVIPKDITVIEFEDHNIMRISIELHNSDFEKLDPRYTNLVIGTASYEKDGGYTTKLEQVGTGTCPWASMEVAPKSVEEFILCYKIPKQSLDVFSLELNDGLYGEQRSIYKISESITPAYMDYESFYQKTFISPLQTMSAELTNAGIREKDDLNILYATFSITNEGNEELRWIDDVHIENTKGQQFETDIAFFSDCRNGIIDINPGLTKSTTYCFEIPKNQYEFEVVIRHNFPYHDDCDGYDGECEEERFNLEIGSSAAPTTPTSSAAPTTPTSSAAPTTPTSSAAPTTPTSTTQQTAGGCGEGTVLINGVCQLSEDVDVTGQNAFDAIAGFILFGIFSIIAIIIIIIIIAILIKRRRTRNTEKLSKQKLAKNDDKQVLDPHVEDQPEMSETVKRIKAKPTLRSRNTFCEECGAQIRLLQKFCGKCGTRVNN